MRYINTSISVKDYDGHSGAMIKEGALKLAKALIFDQGAKLIDEFCLHAEIKPIAEKLGLSEEFKSALSKGKAAEYNTQYGNDAINLMMEGVDQGLDRILPEWLKLG